MLACRYWDTGGGGGGGGGGYRFNVYFDRKEMDEKRKEKRENTEAKNQFEK